MRAQKQGLARAAQNQNLISGDLRTTLQIQVHGNRFTQGLGALRIAMQQDVGSIVFHGLTLQAFPHIGGEVAGFRQASGKGLDGLLIGNAATFKHGATPTA